MNIQEVQCFSYTRGAQDARNHIIQMLSWPRSEDLIKKLAGFPGKGWEQTANLDVKPMLQIIIKEIDGLSDAQS